eukprot:CAMPEP_0181418730 /NCGR_PEP_ID=MMETSP1110-20121109/11708_1 /TAXON_ID=174948 /ORGANISM="Symbiodinium sp., Strain CCMP421" /LENGTH=520 /DNA_ID=CAMNT_0023541723 /DNA_START=85 /DNA_END=1643 /DNA_ORIENTATION=+
MTDRFSRDNDQPCEGDNWCNGTLKGITAHLDYIHGMGWDCIWVTPVVRNVYGPDQGESGYGYHGYWAQDFYEIDPSFGSKEDLKELVSETHRRGMCFILDVVLNHVGPVHSLKELSRIKPFNDPGFFNLLNISGMTFDDYATKAANWPYPVQALGPGAACWLDYTEDGIPDGTNNGTYCNNYLTNNYSFENYLQDRAHGPAYLKYCGTGDYICPGYNETVVLNGWFYDLPDLNHSVPFVRHFLKEWVLHMVKEYHVDGLRLDTASYIAPDFLAEVQDMLLHLARPVPIFGEVTAVNLSYHASFQSRDGRGILAGLSNFPLTYSAIPGYCGWPNAILSPIAQFDLTYLASATQEQSSMLYADTDLLMNMMDNQDEMPIAGLYHTSAGPFSPGEGGCQDDRSLLLNAWAWLMFAKGMPVVTWGDEQGNPFYRMSLWQHGWKTDTWQYKLLRRMNHIRARRQLGRTAAKVQHGSKRLFVFQRGEPNSIAGVWVFTNNLPSGSDPPLPACTGKTFSLGSSLTYL